uniref:Uncharacterized protein n=1 Tax=Octopus bimaculoides TaxID=37653 RepID=A0A0L8H6C4_OCTBM
MNWHGRRVSMKRFQPWKTLNTVYPQSSTENSAQM